MAHEFYGHFAWQHWALAVHCDFGGGGIELWLHIGPLVIGVEAWRV